MARETPMSGSSTLSAQVDAYLADRRQAGFQLRVEGEQLKRFARFAGRIGHRGPLTVKLAMQWANDSRGHRLLTAARRIETLRPFAAYCQQFDPATEIPPRGLFGPAHRRLTPHVFTAQEIRCLLAACRNLHPAGGLRSASCAAIFGLIASSGLRISEATNLKRADVELHAHRLLVREGKYHKSRWIALHPTTTAALRRYARRRDRDAFAKGSDAFFIFDHGRSASSRAVRWAFKVLRAKLKWRSRGGHPAPRVHDLRHGFICHRLEDWYAKGLQIDRHILSLCTYVGHTKVTDTYWYLTATPELLALAAQRFARSRHLLS
jgi:integrase